MAVNATAHANVGGTERDQGTEGQLASGRFRNRGDRVVQGQRMMRPVAIDAYLGAGDEFDLAITDFSQRYADQNERDDQTFVDAVRGGRIEAVEGI